MTIKVNAFSLKFIFRICMLGSITSGALGLSVPANAAGDKAPRNDGAIVFERRSGFGLTIGASGSSIGAYSEERLQFPFSSELGHGVIEKKSGFTFEHKSNKRKSHSLLKIFYPNVSVRNYARAGRAEHYLIPTTTTSGFTNLVMMSLLCAGDSVLAIEHFSGTLRDLLIHSINDSVSTSASTIFATGGAAGRAGPSVMFGSSANLRSREQSQLIKGNYAPSILAQILIQNPDKLDRLLETSDPIRISAPSIITSLDMSVTAARFSQGTSTLPPSELKHVYRKMCTKTFEDIFSDYSLTRQPKKFKLQEFDVIQKKNHIELFQSKEF